MAIDNGITLAQVFVMDPHHLQNGLGTGVRCGCYCESPISNIYTCNVSYERTEFKPLAPSTSSEAYLEDSNNNNNNRRGHQEQLLVAAVTSSC